MGKITCGAVVVFIAFGLGCNSHHQSLPDRIDFNLHIKPILSDRCFACHGPDDNTREADLSFHTRDGLFAELDAASGTHVIVPGNLGKSALYQRITSDESEVRMPPPESNLLLSDFEKSLIAQWIKQGAEWQPHWSFVPPKRPAPPTNRRWGTNSIDGFIYRKIRAHGLKPNEEASREKLARRLYFDLLGLPPTPEELDLVREDPSEKWYSEMVDRIFESPHFGERMAANWLDVSRYADSHGYQDDRPRTMWPWRDWVINAYNDNMPYDQFVTWQLAGDLLPDSLYEQRLATGFNRNHAITQEGGVVNEEYLTEYAADRTDVFATAFLGLTVQCARCHDHKYDPISQKEFYQLFAFFNNLAGERGQISYTDQAPKPSMREENPALEMQIARIKSAIQKLENQENQLLESRDSSFHEWRTQPLILPENLSGEVAHFALDEEAGWRFRNTLDESQKAKVNINLPPHIPRPSRVSGKIGSALRFDGENFLSLGDVGDFEWYDPFTLAAWIRYQDRLDKEGGILARRNGELQRNGYDLFIKPDGRVGIRLIHSLGKNQVEIVSVQRIPKRSWTHIAATSSGSGDASGLSIFINGMPAQVQIVHDSLDRRTIACGNDFLVGNWNHRARQLKNLSGFAGGSVDEVRIFARQLSKLEIAHLVNRAGEVSDDKDVVQEYYSLNYRPQLQIVREQLDSLRRMQFHIPSVMIMEERDSIYPAFVLARGAYDAPMERVNRGTPGSILPFTQSDSNRLGLAQWLFDDENPLTARVMVNRLWQQCFGRGLVNTPEDFGSQGELPSHPELLDWLAVEFRESGWDIKHMMKVMVMSSTYRQSQAMSSRSLANDKDNIWLSRGPRRPLTAEMLRDQALKASGLLNENIGGKWVKPYQPPGIWKELANQIGENKYRPSKGPDLFRRSIYTYWKRTIPPPTMLTLDAPERAVCTVKRQATSTPLQSLILLNDPQYVEAARALSEYLLTTCEGDLAKALSEAFERFTSRDPGKDELSALLQLHANLEEEFNGSNSTAAQWLSVGTIKPDSTIDPSSLGAMTAAVSAILNLDESKYR